ncbi:MAG TPA: decarboxylating 6-phosphogluconate dehydrogenase [Steroidobacteraceae bacterium]|nr:decarboxylating 6-phosphogluconate dehydrogenase [Steroidobacteraceae bacterium]
MDIAMIGLGKMGANMARRLLAGGHRVVGYDPAPAARGLFQQGGGTAVDSLENAVAALAPPRTVWIMVPAGAPTDETLARLEPLLAAGDTIVDGGNSYYRDTLRRAAAAAHRNLQYIDSGTSGGVWGLKEGYSLMIGGDAAAVERLRPIFATLAPAPDRGWGRVGPAGAGHFTKMVHNGIEYGLMEAYAEGFSILSHKREFDLDLHQIAEIWRYGSVVRSWLLDLTANALATNPKLEGIAPYVADSGEGRWTVMEAIELGVPAFVIAQSLLERLRSRDTDSFSDKLLAAMRNQFGGHAIKSE